MYTIMLFAAGRRVQLLEQIQLQADGLNIPIKMIAVESHINTPISQYCETVLETDFVREKYLYNNEGTYALCCNDFLSTKMNQVLEGTKINFVGSSPLVNMMCYDKYMMHHLLYNKYYYPRFDLKEKHLVVQKPAKGNGSKDIHFSFDECRFKSKDWVTQKLISGQEYTIDAFFKNRRIVACCTRSRDRVIGGEVAESTIVENIFSSEIEDINQAFCFNGPVTFQFFKSYSGDKYLIEINSRLGGGVTLSMASGGYPLVDMIINPNFEIAPQPKFISMKRVFKDVYFD